MRRQEIFGLLGHKVVVGLNSADAGGVEIFATLDEVRDDGIVLSQISDLVPGPTLLCPWESFQQAHDRPSWFMPPREEEVSGEELQIREVPESVMPFEESDVLGRLPERREPSAGTLERVVPVAQRMTVGGITVAISSLELYGEGLGVLRWRVSFGEEALRRDPDLGFGMPEPEFEIRDEGGRTLPGSPRGAGYSVSEGDGESEVRDLPETGELEVDVRRLVSDAYGDEEYRGNAPSYEGPWNFRFAL